MYASCMEERTMHASCMEGGDSCMHHAWKREPCMFHGWNGRCVHVSCMRYVETYMFHVQNFQQGKHRKIQPKKVKHQANYQRPERCFVRLFKACCAHHPPKVEHDSFYPTTIQNPRSIVWYQVTPVGHYTLAKQMCSSTGVDGYKTNHSLRVTTATRLFQSRVDQQHIMQTTGHLSMDGVRPYERDSDQQQQIFSTSIQVRRCR